MLDPSIRLISGVHHPRADVQKFTAFSYSPSANEEHKTQYNYLDASISDLIIRSDSNEKAAGAEGLSKCAALSLDSHKVTEYNLQTRLM
jgi:hypothetical protein